jgi:peptide/nickel transport system ATP-binding protein
MSLLEVQNLRMHYQTAQGLIKAVDGVSFEMRRGEALGLVGESGCGKSSVALSIMRLLPPNGRLLGGKILFHNEDLLAKDEEEMRKIRGRRISLIFQAALNALNPVHRVGDQIMEAIQAHERIGKKEVSRRVEELYKLVGLDPGMVNSYPHQYSGGMKQRAIIAMALSCKPELLIADEPTTALDVIIQDQIIREIMKLQKRFNLTLIYISHDISLIAETCSSIGVMYAGKLVEYAPTITLFQSPLHPYTKGLLSSYPSIKGPKRRISPIPGEVPNLLHPPLGCRFHPRCSKALKICREKEPEYRRIKADHYIACHLIKGTL